MDNEEFAIQSRPLDSGRDGAIHYQRRGIQAITSFHTYYSLTKPGIIRGNLLVATAGFLLASKGHVKLGLLLAVLAGTSLVIASACVFNNYIDRGIDKKMFRTKGRAIVSGLVSGRNALIYAAVLGVAGFLVLGFYTNWLTLLIGAIGFVVYVVFYGLSKRSSVHGTLVGSIAGATPPIAGYCAVTGNLDTGAVLLFLILALWQMPHFYSIAMYRLDDYKAAGLPVLPVKKGTRAAKLQIITYIAAFIAAVAALKITGYAGWTYLVVMLLVGLAWLGLGIKGFKAADDVKWARQMFFFSLLVILTLSIALSADSFLP